MPKFDLLSHDESLFKAPGILDQEYLPRLLPYREEQQKYLADCIKNILLGGKNLLIYGGPGIGKTACIRWVFRELEEKGEEDIISIYINCWKENSLHKILLQLCNQLGIKTRILSPDELLETVLRKLKSFKGIVFAFDEIDKVQDHSFLYHILEEVKYKTIFMISTTREWLAKLDQRIHSRLIPELMKFEPYNREQTLGILEERKKYAFVQGVWESEAFEAVVDKCYEAKDIRIGLLLLKKSGLAAENDASTKITLEHVKRVIEKLELGKEKKLTNFKS